MRQLSHSIQTADVIIIARNGQGVSYVIPLDLVILLLLFLSSTTIQVLALLTLALAGRLYQGWLWLTDWPAWVDGWRVVVEDFRRVGRVCYVG